MVDPDTSNPNTGGEGEKDEKPGEGDENKSTDAITGKLRHNEHHKKPIESWVRSIIVRQACHSKLATEKSEWDSNLNMASVVLSAISSSAVFATTNPTINSTLDGIPSGKSILSWVVGLIAAASTIIQATLKARDYATLAEQHRSAVRQCTKLRFRMEIIVGENWEDDGNLLMNKLGEWTREYEDLLDTAPIIPQDIFVEMMKSKFPCEEKPEDTENARNNGTYIPESESQLT